MNRVLSILALAAIGAGTARAKAQCILVIDHTQTVCATGVFPASALVVGVGSPVVNLPPTTFTNNSQVEVRFEIDWSSSTLAGGGVIASSVVDIPAGGGTVSVASPSFSIDTTGVSVGVYNIAMAWSAVSPPGCSGSGCTVEVEEARNVEVDVVLPQQVQELLQVPVRFCAIEGTAQAEGRPAGSLATGTNLFSLLRQVDAEVWIPQASILFRPAPGPPGVPVIKAPVTGQPQFPGGVFSDSLDPTIWCETAWQSAAPTQPGIIVVNSGVIIPDINSPNGTIAGFTAPPADALIVADAGEPNITARPNDLCGSPRRLAVTDVTPVNRATVYDQALYNDSVTPVYTGPTPGDLDPVHTLAHELGHTLTLGHGNGLDDNGDGLLPPNPGIRRYDAVCDALLDTGEDVLTPVTSPCTETRQSSPMSSIMRSPATLCENLQPLQREQARDVALLVPGTVSAATSAIRYGQLPGPADACQQTCSHPSPLAIQKVEVAETPANSATSIALTVPRLPPGGPHTYVVYADIDQQAQTGCGSPAPGAAGGLPGAELAAQVVLDTSGATPRATPTVWTCSGGSWTGVSTPGITAAAYAQSIIDESGAGRGRGNGSTGPGIISIEMPDAIHAPLGSAVRIQVVAMAQAGGETLLLPSSGGGATVSLTAPALPTCTVSPPLATPGSSVTPSVTSLPPNTPVDVYLGPRKMTTVTTDAGGQATAQLLLPATLPSGMVAAVEFQAQGAPASSVCGVLVQGGAATPATTATLTPPPNTNGWNRTAVTVALAAVDVSGGGGVQQLTFASSGAQTIPSTTRPGASATFPIDTQGITSVQFSATDPGGVAEGPETLQVRIDETPPTVNYSGNQAIYGILDTVNITCTAADALSGLAVSTCRKISGPGYLFNTGHNTFEARASDLAGNVGHGTVNFAVRVTYGDLCSLTSQFAGSAAQIHAPDICAQLTAAEQANLPAAKEGHLQEYIHRVIALTPRVFSPSQAGILTALARAL